MEFMEMQGKLVAEGVKGHYLITDGAWSYLERVVPMQGSTHVEQLGAYFSNIEAMAAAEKLDEITN